MRKIIHVDMDAFYASVEQRDDPALRGKPVVVAWEAERSVVCAASYEARKFGVRSAMPATRARRLAPDAIFVKPNFEKYRAVSRQIRQIFERHTPLVEPLSLDEAYLDVTQELTGLPTATDTAVAIRREIREETNLTASAGVAPNKFLAKIASDWKKPDGLFVIKPHQIEEFLPPLAVSKIPGVGPATEAVLLKHGVEKVGDLLRFSQEQLSEIFGKFGIRLWELARGIDESPVEAHRKAKSISVETTFGTDVPIDEVARYLERAVPDLWGEGTSARTVTVKLRRADFVTATRQQTPPQAPASAEEVVAIAKSLLEKFPFEANAKYRLAGVGLSNFEEDDVSETEDASDESRLF